jgi:hypothetical protein
VQYGRICRLVLMPNMLLHRFFLPMNRRRWDVLPCFRSGGKCGTKCNAGESTSSSDSFCH